MVWLLEPGSQGNGSPVRGQAKGGEPHCGHRTLPRCPVPHTHTHKGLQAELVWRAPEEEKREQQAATPCPVPSRQPTGVPAAQKPCEQQPAGGGLLERVGFLGCINAWSPGDKKQAVTQIGGIQLWAGWLAARPGALAQEGMPCHQAQQSQQPETLSWP